MSHKWRQKDGTALRNSRKCASILPVVTLFIFEGDFLFAQLILSRHDSVFSDFSEVLSNHIFEARVLLIDD